MLVISIFFQIFCLSGIWAKPQPQVSKFVSQCGVRNKQGVGIPIENDVKRQAKVSVFYAKYSKVNLYSNLIPLAKISVSKIQFHEFSLENGHLSATLSEKEAIDPKYFYLEHL